MQIVAAYPLNVRLSIHPENVQIAYGKKLEMIFTPFHQKMHKLFSSYSDGELSFLVDVLTKSIELTREESKKLRTSLQGQSSSRSIGDRH